MDPMGYTFFCWSSSVPHWWSSATVRWPIPALPCWSTRRAFSAWPIPDMGKSLGTQPTMGCSCGYSYGYTLWYFNPSMETGPFSSMIFPLCCRGFPIAMFDRRRVTYNIPVVKITRNVNPGLINPKRLFNWEGTIKKYHLKWLFGYGTPTINVNHGLLIRSWHYRC